MSSADAEVCGFDIDPDRWERAHDRPAQLRPEDLDENGVWSCQRPAGPDGCCLFHRDTDEKDDEEVVEAFLAAVHGERDEALTPAARKQFIGAKFGSFAIPYAVLDTDDNHPVDLRHARIEGTFDWRSVVVAHPLWLAGATVDGAAECQDIRPQANVDASGARFEAGADFSDARFADNVWFLAAEFGDNVEFQRATIGTDVELTGARVAGYVRFGDAEIGGVAAFSRMHVDGRLLMSNTPVGGNAWVVHSTFESEKGGNSHLGGGTFERSLRIRDSTFGGALSLAGADVEGPLELSGVEVAGDEVDLSGCEISSGTLAPGEHARAPVFDLTDATVGNVALEGVGFDRIRVNNTSFTEFDFSSHDDLLEAVDWRLDRVDGEREQSVDDAETTFLKAKNGAIAVGAQHTAGEFFRKEMTFRRYQHWDRAAGRDDIEGSLSHRLWERALAAGRWVANALLNAFTGYGERPWRVLGWSLLFVVGFTALFWWGLSREPTVAAGARALVFSFQSFVSFVVGPAPGVNLLWVQVVSAVEGFVGAFFVALFVFAITRSVHR